GPDAASTSTRYSPESRRPIVAPDTRLSQATAGDSGPSSSAERPSPHRASSALSTHNPGWDSIPGCGVPSSSQEFNVLRGRKVLVRRLLVAFAAFATVFGASLVPAQADTVTDPYSTPGVHLVNDRYWRTTCSMYSTTVVRCTTDIYG